MDKPLAIKLRPTKLSDIKFKKEENIDIDY